MFLSLTAKSVRTYVGICSLFCAFLIILIRMIIYVHTTFETSTQIKKQRTIKKTSRSCRPMVGSWRSLSLLLFCRQQTVGCIVWQWPPGGRLGQCCARQRGRSEDVVAGTEMLFRSIDWPAQHLRCTRAIAQELLRDMGNEYQAWCFKSNRFLRV